MFYVVCVYSHLPSYFRLLLIMITIMFDVAGSQSSSSTFNRPHKDKKVENHWIERCGNV